MVYCQKGDEMATRKTTKKAKEQIDDLASNERVSIDELHTRIMAKCKSGNSAIT